LSREIGMQLRRARESMGMTIVDIARKANIELKYVIAIEKGEWDRLPNMIYARAYVKNYAQLVGETVSIAQDQTARRAAVTVEEIETPYRRRSRSERGTQRHDVYAESLHSTQKRRAARQIEAEVFDTDEIEISRRQVQMPDDMPDPEEFGISSHMDESAATYEDTDEYETFPSRSRQEFERTRDGGESRWGIWYTRLLIAGGVLLAIGLAYFFYLKFTNPAGMPIA
jgi:transcriptional regulator with XRE-family HTH domain